ncbi:MAG: DNA-binding protein [Candidatus Thermoplasmatota archaeon]|nr:DNA-binding protein [Candidatus Thermoplasmatota archaeon]
MDEELERLRRKRLQELQQEENLQQSLEGQEAQQTEYEEQKKQILRSILTPDAKDRLTNIKISRPQIAEQIEQQLIILAQSGRLRQKITDDQLRQLLARLIPKKRDINIERR